MSKEKTYHLYDHNTGELFYERDMTEAEAQYRNKILRNAEDDRRWIVKHDPPSNSCTCGAEAAYECVCN